MPFNRDSLSTVVARAKADVETRLEGADTKLRRANTVALPTVNAGLAHEAYGYLEWGSEQILPDTAESDFLDRHANVWGIVRTAATAATGSAEATGTDGALIPAGTLVQRSDQVEYAVDADATISGGTATLALTATEGGETTNSDPATSLSLISPISGVDTAVTVDSAGLTGGDDIESDPALLIRLLARIQGPPHGGAAADYVAWAKEVAGVTRAWSYESWSGLGSVGLTFVRDNDGTGTAILPDSTELTEVSDYIEEHIDPATGLTVGRPVTARVIVFAPTAKDIDFTISVSPDTATIRAAIEAELDDLIYREGEPGGTLYISRINEAISLAEGEFDHTLVSPAANQTIDDDEIAFVGTITWS